MNSYSKYFPISEYDKLWGLYILNCGTLKLADKNMPDIKLHPQNYILNWENGRVLYEYQMIYLIEGEGVFENEFIPLRPVKTGSVILISPKTWHRYKPKEGANWNTYWVGFNGSLAEQFISNLGIGKENPIMEIGYSKSVIESYLEIIRISELEHYGYQQIMMGEVIKLIGKLNAILKKSEFTHKKIDKLINEAKTLLIHEYTNEPLEAVASELNLSYSLFRKIFRDYTGISPGEYQMQHKINRAINYLADNKTSIKQISIELGYQTPQYFSRLFKRRTGKSPKAYRQLIVNKVYAYNQQKFK